MSFSNHWPFSYSLSNLSSDLIGFIFTVYPVIQNSTTTIHSCPLSKLLLFLTWIIIIAFLQIFLLPSLPCKSFSNVSSRVFFFFTNMSGHITLLPQMSKGFQCQSKIPRPHNDLASLAGPGPIYLSEHTTSSSSPLTALLQHWLLPLLETTRFAPTPGPLYFLMLRASFFQISAWLAHSPSAGLW